MELILKRTRKPAEYTQGKLYIADKGSGIVSRTIKYPKNLDAKPIVTATVDEYALTRLIPFCDTLEPTWRNLLGKVLTPGEEDVRIGRTSGRRAKKSAGQTAIPEGSYRVLITKSPAMGGKWLPLVMSVPGFEGIRIHAGNTRADTQGCILVGQSLAMGTLTQSRQTLERLMRHISACMERTEPVWLTVV